LPERVRKDELQRCGILDEALHRGRRPEAFILLDLTRSARMFDGDPLPVESIANEVTISLRRSLEIGDVTIAIDEEVSAQLFSSKRQVRRVDHIFGHHDFR